MTPEGKVKAMVKRNLKTLAKVYSFMPVQNGMGAPGLDLFNCINGYFVAIETKAKGKTLTPRQEQTKADIEAAGGLVLVVDDFASMALAMATIEDLVNPGYHQ